MKKYVTMLVLGLVIAGTAQAQTEPQTNGKNKSENRKGVTRGEKQKNKEWRRADRRATMTPEQKATRRTEKLSQRLDLNPNQQKRLQALNLKQTQEVANFRSQLNQSGNRQDHRAAMQQLHANYEKALKNILSKKQYAQYQEERKQVQAQREERSGRDGNPNRRQRQPSNS